MGSKHWPWQNNTLSGQPHTPPKHGTPASHALPQPPQLAASLLTFAQVPPHFSKPAAHAVLHEPLAHTAGAVQAVPHAPQWALSACRLTQALPQAASPGWHTRPFGPAPDVPCPPPTPLLGPSIVAVHPPSTNSNATA